MRDILQLYSQLYGKTPNLRDPTYFHFLERVRTLSKFKILEYPLMAPGRCLGCTSCKDDRKYIDFGTSVDGYGVIYICTSCLKHLFDMLSFKPVDERDAEVRNRFRVKLSEIKLNCSGLAETMLENMKELEEVFYGVRKSGSLVDVDSNSVNSDSDDFDDSDTDTVNEEPAEVDIELDGPEQGINESNTESGSKDIPNLTKLLRK